MKLNFSTTKLILILALLCRPCLGVSAGTIIKILHRCCINIDKKLGLEKAQLPKGLPSFLCQLSLEAYRMDELDKQIPGVEVRLVPGKGYCYQYTPVQSCDPYCEFSNISPINQALLLICLLVKFPKGRSFLRVSFNYVGDDQEAKDYLVDRLAVDLHLPKSITGHREQMLENFINDEAFFVCTANQ